MESLLQNNSGLVLVIYIVVFGAIMYFLMIRPQRNEQKKAQAMLSALEKGDYVLTTSGFYGTVIDIQEDTVIVEFGNNKNCRIPMQKAAISQVEKAE
ncbi:MAG: preprotein translocase subunit YajC [Lachnospiraceae bacterium]|nr:preprotein translocase subunit YajC [Lachnospiraceae bacterium]